jgi:hypothetical protein
MQEVLTPQAVLKLPITTGVCYRLTKLTTINKTSVDMKLDEIYPEHFSALNKADLLNNFNVPTLGAKAAELKAALEDEFGQATKKRRERDRKRAIYFKVGFSNYWQKPIHKTICKVKSRFPSLTWLCISMSYHRFSNLRELFQSNLNTKLNSTIISKDFQTSLATAGINKHAHTKASVTTQLWYIKQRVSRRTNNISATPNST